MDKEYWNYLKEHDPMHYAEMKGDPVTGLNNDPSSCFVFVLIGILLIVSLPILYIVILL